MNRLQEPRRFAMTLASLGLLVIPFGCGSETPVAEVPAPPSAVADSHVNFVPTPMPGIATGAVEPPGAMDPSIRQASGEMKHEAADARKEVRDAEGDVKKAASDVEGEAKDKAKAIEAEARKAAEEALDKLLPGPK